MNKSFVIDVLEEYFKAEVSNKVIRKNNALFIKLKNKKTACVQVVDII